LLVGEVFADIDPLRDERSGSLQLLNRCGRRLPLGLFLRALPTERGDLGAMLFDLLGEKFPLHVDQCRTGARWRMKFALRIGAAA
jgi:hypothetical protein